MELKELYLSDKRGLNGGEGFVEQIDDNHAILGYYGMGDVHEAIYLYNPATGWEWKKYYDREWEKLSSEEKTKMFAEIVEALKKNGFTKIEKQGDQIKFSRNDEL